MLHRYYLLLLSLHLSLFLLLCFLLSLYFFLLFPLDYSDAFVEFGEEMGKFRVDFVDEIAEVSTCLIIDSFEEHDRGEVLLEIL